MPWQEHFSLAPKFRVTRGDLDFSNAAGRICVCVLTQTCKFGLNSKERLRRILVVVATQVSHTLDALDISMFRVFSFYQYE